MNLLLSLEEQLNPLDSLVSLLGIEIAPSASSATSEDSYHYRDDNLICETYEWAWSDNHRDLAPGSLGLVGPVEGMMQARLEQEARIKPYLSILFKPDPHLDRRKIASKKRIRKPKRK